jgi:hypothetical protein
MQAPIAGLHLALVALLGLLGLSFIADPCGGGGDLCLGGLVGLMALGVAGFGLLGLGLWQLWRRATLLVILDSVLVAVLGPIALQSTAYGPGGLAALGMIGTALLALVGVVFAASHVARHRLESIVVLVALGALALNRDTGGPGVLVVGVVALALGWLVARSSTAAEPVTATSAD